MIELMITGANEAPDILASGWATRAVSLLGKRDAHRVPHTGQNHLTLYFDDTELVNDTNAVSVSPWHIARVLEHTADLKDGDRLFIHCKAGKSRSTAMAIGIMIQHGMSPKDAFDYVKRVRDVAIPNRLMIDFIDQHFALNGELNRVVETYYEGLMLPGVRLPHRGGWNL